MKWIIYFFLFTLVVSCTKEVKIAIPGYKEQVVVDGFIETGMPPFVLLSKSRDIYSETNLNSFLNGFISGAIVTVSDGTHTVQLTELCSDNLPPGMEETAAEFFGIKPEQLAQINLCAYVGLDPSIFGVVGKTYTLKVEYEGKEYTSSTTLLTPVPLQQSYFKPEADKPECGFAYHRLQDPPGGKNAYYYEVKRINKDSLGKNKDSYFKKIYNYTFDDQFFDGLNFEFYCENPMTVGDKNVEPKYRGYYMQGDSVVIKFSTIDRTVYDFQLTKLVQLQTGGSPFSSASNIKTNITGGALGVWAGYSTTFDTLYCVP